MGSKYEVCSWEQNDLGGPDRLGYVQYYAGESLISAVWWMWKLKRCGRRCVKLEYRP